MKPLNLQALICLGLLFLTWGIARMIRRLIETGMAPAFVIYLRVLFGFMLAMLIWLGYNTLTGKVVLSKLWGSG
ncbi:MAG: flagellar biosynthesis protein FliR [Synergistetes bacterium]|nr:flagellar biosynthesis protein FliR [Synergistota bacterium]